MEARASRTGLALSALGGMATAISVFLPWYGISFTRAAVDFATGAITRFLPQLNGSSFVESLRAAGNAAAGHDVANVSAHQVLSHTSTVLLAIGGAAALFGVLSLAQGRPLVPNWAGLMSLIGFAGAALVAWKMLSMPDPAPGLIKLSLKGGAYLALLGCLAIAGGALWPRTLDAPKVSAPAPAGGDDVWSELSGWTPSA